MGCGAGKYMASCGAEGTDSTETRPNLALSRYTEKHYVNLRENARRKLICDVNIIAMCLNTNDLPEVPPKPLVVSAPYATHYS